MAQCKGADMSGRCPNKADEDSGLCSRHQKEVGVSKRTKGPRHSPEIGEKRKADGQARVSMNNESWMAMARSALQQLAREKSKVNADDLRYYLHENDLPEPSHPGAFGAAFSTSGLVITGEYTKSTWPDSARRRIPYWRLP